MCYLHHSGGSGMTEVASLNLFMTLVFGMGIMIGRTSIHLQDHVKMNKLHAGYTGVAILMAGAEVWNRIIKFNHIVPIVISSAILIGILVEWVVYASHNVNQKRNG